LSLCRQLSASPLALAAACQSLAELGLAFRSQAPHLLQLEAPIDWLDQQRLQSGAEALGIDLAVTGICSSTNAVLAATLKQRTLPCALLAEGQSGGRGRRGRGWTSPPGAGIYLSLGWRSQRSLAELAPLGLIISLAAARALNAFQHAAVKVKWPNDLQVGGRKLGGCLVDLNGTSHGPCDVIIGLGINVCLPKKTSIDQPWADLRGSGFDEDRSTLAIALLNELIQSLQVLESKGSAALLAAWPSLDALAGKEVEVRWEDGRQVQGRAVGIDARGHLRLAGSEGCLSLHSGDVRVRLA